MPDPLPLTNKQKRSLRMRAAREKGTHTKLDWEILCRLCCDSCVRCGRTACPIERDHILPVYQGGSDAIANIQPLCPWCNASKGPESIDHRPAAVKAAMGIE